MTTTFEKPRHAQRQSQFCQLPAELRYLILRELFGFQDCSDQNCKLYQTTIDTSPLVQKTRDHLRAGFRLAQTCQLFKEDGLHIFYAENMLRFDFCNQNWPPDEVSCSLPDVYGLSYFAMNFASRPLIYTTLEEHDRQNLGYSFDCAGVCGSFGQFTDYQITFTDAEQHRNLSAAHRARAISDICRRFRAILFHKRLDIRLEGRWRTPKQEYDLLLGYKILRCKSITIDGAATPRYIEEYVLGTVEVDDTYNEWSHLVNELTVRLPWISIHDWSCPVDFVVLWEDELDKVDLVALQYNRRAFSAQLKIVIKEIRIWMKTWMRQNPYKLEAEYSKLTAVLEKQFCAGHASVSADLARMVQDGLIDEILKLNSEDISERVDYHVWGS